MTRHILAAVALVVLSACTGSSTALGPLQSVDASDSDVATGARVDAGAVGMGDATRTGDSSGPADASQVLDGGDGDVAPVTQVDSGAIGVADAASSTDGTAFSSPPDGTCPIDNSAVDSGFPVQVDQADAVRIAVSAIGPDVLAAAVSANNEFSLDIYSRLLATAGTSNVVTSPLSASLALTMAYAGANGETATQMATALHIESDAGSIFDGQNAMEQMLDSRQGTALAAAQQSGVACPSPGDYELQIVNSVWGQQTYTWSPSYLTLLAQSYGTGVVLQDFVDAPDNALQSINSWVSSETGGVINNLLSPGSIDTHTRMVLVNAIHLKFPWVTSFDPTATAPATFTRGDGTSVTASFMNLTSTFPYVDDGQAQIVDLPLTGNQLSIIIALPHAGVDLAAYEAGLTTSSAALVPSPYTVSVALSLPKIDTTSPPFSLSGALQAMGMVNAFDAGVADFTAMCASPPDGERLYVKDVLQKAEVEMKETGVQAAAATGVIVTCTYCGLALVPDPVPMVVDRPYLFAIVDNPTGAVLFLGHIEDPTSAGSP
jgi:serpin B